MQLIERAGFLASLYNKFKHLSTGEGHCIFISGEAGIGKTSVVKAFCREIKGECNIYIGICDALFTPRPLAPLYDILLQLRNEAPDNNIGVEERTALFAKIFHELHQQQKPCVIIFEDIHWADEATLDFIKFFARRITQLPCLFILTYRDNEIDSNHALRNVLGQLSPDSFTRLQLQPLSKEAVEKMAEEKGYDGAAIYSISAGNPFYVTEILASYSPGVPDNIKDSILAVYNRQDEKTRHAWQILSVLPTGFEMAYLEKIDPSYAPVIQHSLDAGIIVPKGKYIQFKHELYRRTIEASLSPLVRLEYNKRILALLKDNLERDNKIEQIVHHAKNANEYSIVTEYAPVAARQAASVGAHIEASRLYLSAIEYYQGDDKDMLIDFYESYAYECYLTNQVRQAIIYMGKALNLWKEKENPEKIGNCMRFLSRLWWFEGNHKQAENFASQAIEEFFGQPSSKAKAMAFSNISQLKMLSDFVEESVFWGEKAINIARELGDEETEAHALNSVGSALMTRESSIEKGVGMLQQSLEIALRNGYHEHVARAYTALGSNWVTMKHYTPARAMLDEGIRYSEERNLDSLKMYMLSWKARMLLETGHGKEAFSIAESLLRIEELLCVIKIGVLSVMATIKIRRGDPDALPMLLEARKRAFETCELQRIIPALAALIEYEWITGERTVDNDMLDKTIGMFKEVAKVSKHNRLFRWLRRARPDYLPESLRYDGYDDHSEQAARDEAGRWVKVGCPYEQALALFEGSEDDKREAIAMVHTLGATAVYEKMKQEMRTSGIKSIPRGIRKNTQSNPAFLTDRELDVIRLLHDGLQNKEIAARLFISAKTVDHHISSILFKLDAPSRTKAVQEATRLGIIK